MMKIVLVATAIAACLLQANGQTYEEPQFSRSQYQEQSQEETYIRPRRQIYEEVEFDHSQYEEESQEQGYIRPKRQTYEEAELDHSQYEEDDAEEQPHIRIRRQFFGGVSRLPGGGSSQTAGYQAGPAWGSLSQSSNAHGFTSPITIGGGLGHTSPAGHGLSGSFAAQPGIGGQASLRGQVGLLNTPSHQVTAFGQHDRAFDKNVRFVGSATNSAGLNYLNKNNGAGAFVSGSHTPGFPNTGTVGGNVPLINANGGRTRLDVTGQTSFGQGMKPNHQVGLQLNHNF